MSTGVGLGIVEGNGVLVGVGSTSVISPSHSTVTEYSIQSKASIQSAIEMLIHRLLRRLCADTDLVFPFQSPEGTLIVQLS